MNTISVFLLYYIFCSGSNKDVSISSVSNIPLFSNIYIYIYIYIFIILLSLLLEIASLGLVRCLSPRIPIKLFLSVVLCMYLNIFCLFCNVYLEVYNGYVKCRQVL